jgi:hypothetical protein
MKVLELFSGTECISNAFRARDHECFTIDWDKQFPSSWHADLSKVTAQDILERFGIPDVVWMAPNCKTYSLAAISKHRVKNVETGNLDPISKDAVESDECNIHVLELLEELRKINPNLLFFIENPRACLQNMTWMKPYDKYKHLITYCKYSTDLPLEERRMKPTNIWTNHSDPKFEKPCKNGDSCHVAAPRGSKTGTQGMKGHRERSMYPKQLCEHIVNISEEYYEEIKND